MGVAEAGRRYQNASAVQSEETFLREVASEEGVWVPELEGTG